MSGVRRILSILAGLALAITGLACAADSGAGTRGGGGGGSGGGGADGGIAGGDEGEATHAQCTDGLDNDGDGRGDCADESCAIWTECGGSATGGADSGLGECASVVSEARETLAPVDILWVVDSSGSMTQEADLVQMNINSFAADISASGVDYHVVMMTADRFVTVPPPLGTDSERYLFIDQPIGSHDAFEQLLARYDSYSSFLREGAALHVVVVTDDESDMGEGEFRTMFEARLGHDFRFHAVASPDEEHCESVPLIGMICQPGCEGPYDDAADVGARYYSLAGMTGGTTFSICATDWSPLWTTLRESVVVSAMLPCYYELPEPPAGEVFSVDRVNVAYTDPSGAETVLPRAVDATRCNDATGTPVRAWHYDDNEDPTQIILCPAACELAESATDGARVDIALGCDTEMVLI